MSVPGITKVDLSHFPTDERFAQIPGKIVLTDNIDDEWPDYEEQQHPNFPVQMTMTACIICLSGEMNMDIDLKNYTLRDGYTAILLPGTFFQLKEVKPGTKCVFFAISPDFIKFISDVKTSIEYGGKVREHPVAQPDAKELEENIALYKALKRKLKDKDYRYKEEVASAYMRIIQCNISQNFVTPNGKQPETHMLNRKEELFMRFVAVVKEHYTQHRNITFYADKLCVSPKYLSSVVHAASGKYATEWINQHVVLEAKTMLRSPGLSIKDVSNQLNFANQSFFAKFFKQHTGYTPKEYKAL